MQTLIDKKTGLIRQAIGIVVFDFQFEGVWLSQKIGGSFDGLWQCPGGRLEKGETPEIGAARELKEGTGLVRYFLPSTFVLTTVGGNFQGRFLQHWTITQRVPGERLERTEPGESQGWHLIAPKDLQSLKMIPNLIQVLKLLHAPNLGRGSEIKLVHNKS